MNSFLFLQIPLCRWLYYNTSGAIDETGELLIRRARRLVFVKQVGKRFSAQDKVCRQHGGAADDPGNGVDVQQHVEAAKSREHRVDPQEPEAARSENGDDRWCDGVPHTAQGGGADFIGIGDPL